MGWKGNKALTQQEERDILKLRKLQAALSFVTKELIKEPSNVLHRINKNSYENQIKRIKEKYFYIVEKGETLSDA